MKSDTELVDDLREQAAMNELEFERVTLRLAADRLAALAFQLVGEEKARHLLRKGMESQCELMDGLKQEARKLAEAIRKHRDQRGDDRCWMDDEELYRSLPEGYTPPARDSAVELKNCERYIACRHNPATEYVSPEREIEVLRAERDAAVGRVQELEAGLKPFVSAPPDPADNMLYSVYVTGAALRRAAELLAGEGGGR